jgi:hypothetical protein
MIEDYQYTPTPLPPKNKGLFGFGGQPSEGSVGLSASVSLNSTAGGGGEQGQQGPQGEQGPPGPPGPLVSGSFGSILYSTGSAWVALSPPSGGTYVLASTGGAPYWMATEECNV